MLTLKKKIRILAMGMGQKRLKEVEDRSRLIRSMTCSLSFGKRTGMGALRAMALVEKKEQIMKPDEGRQKFS